MGPFFQRLILPRATLHLFNNNLLETNDKTDFVQRSSLGVLLFTQSFKRHLDIEEKFRLSRTTLSDLSALCPEPRLVVAKLRTKASTRIDSHSLPPRPQISSPQPCSLTPSPPILPSSCTPTWVALMSRGSEWGSHCRPQGPSPIARRARGQPSTPWLEDKKPSSHQVAMPLFSPTRPSSLIAPD